MKASLKFREEQKPLFRAKVPLNILGFPFQSGIVAGEPKELSLNLSTFFESGPSLKIAYRPNDSVNPFSLIFKTGIGHFGSPISSSMNMRVEFNLIGGSQNPSFFVHFKPQFGDFTLKKVQSSAFKKQDQSKTIAGGGGAIEDGAVMVDLLENGKRFAISSSESPAAGLVKGVLSDVEVSARTTVPLRKHAMLNFRWGVRLPPAVETEEAALVVTKRNNNPTAGISFDKFPLLIMNKIGIEHVAARDALRDSNKAGVGPNDAADGDVKAACLGIKGQLEIMQAENGMLRKAMDDLRSEFSAIKSGNFAGKFTGGGEKKSMELNESFGGKAMEGEVVNEEMKKKKGMKGSTGV